MIFTLAQNAAAATAGGDENYLVWGFLLLAVALGLLFVEFLIPSGGLIGMLCGIAAVGSVVSFFMYDTMWGVVMACAYVILTPIVLVFFFKIWLSSPLAKRMILMGHTESINPTTEDSEEQVNQQRQKRLADLQQLIGVEGVTVTALRPVGVVKIQGQRVDAMAESGVIEANVPIEVTDVYDNQIKVRPV